MRVLLAAVGTRGDVQPLFAIARALIRAGDVVRVAAPPDFAGEAQTLGVPFSGFERPIQPTLQRNAEAVGRNPLPLMLLTKRQTEEDIPAMFELLRDLAGQADLVVGAGILLAGASAAEIARVPYRFLAYAPDALRSRHHAPAHIPLPSALRPLNPLAWVLSDIAGNWMARRPLNRARRAHGLLPIPDVMRHGLPTDRAILAAEPELAPLPPDLRGVRQTGALFLDDPRPLGDELEAFLRDGQPPVYLGFGSMPNVSAEETTRTLVEMASRVGCRAVISSGWAGLGARAALSAGVHIVGSVPHARLFPRCRAVVHHGGAGTVHAAARAGAPQIVVPFMLDQFGWGRRVHEAGLGPPPMPLPRLTVERLAGAVTATLGDDGMAARARDLGQRIAARDGAARLMEALREAAAGR